MAVALTLGASAAAECFPFEHAGAHLGESVCIRGKVLKVSRVESGVTFLNFCEDYRGCPFTVVVFPSDMRDVGDVRYLEGKEIKIQGTVKAYKSQIEIVLKDRTQLQGEFAKLPKPPKDFDANRRGGFSAGAPKAAKRSTGQDAKRKTPQDRRNPDIDVE